MKKLPAGRVLRICHALAVCCGLGFLTISPATGQEIICDGSTQTIMAVGTFEDFILPNDPNVAQIELMARGGDGGFADLKNGCFSEGGAGATAMAVFNLGNGDGAIPYGSTIRFVVGIAGEKGTGGTVLGNGNTYGGGGGGTGILYKAPGSDEWKILVVAGGGGGASQGSFFGICVDSKTGQGGRAGMDGGDGNGANGGQGGSGGDGGNAGGLPLLEVSGGGGGADFAGAGIACFNFEGSTEVAEGQAGFPGGGAGGNSEGCFGSTFRDGGFGFGGGAAGEGGGGGGGGFSGGGGGGTSGRGGGGGSFIAEDAASQLIEEGGLTPSTENGFAQYRCIERVDPPDEGPVASCIDEPLLISINDEGFVNISPELIADEDLDPNWSYSLSTSAFTCDSIGERVVTLTVMNGDGDDDSCSSTVIISDDEDPEVDCPASTEINCGEDASVGSLGMATAVDNCGSVNLELTETVLPGDCAAETAIARVWTATDASGNSASCEQVILILDLIPPVCENCPEDITVSCDEIPEMPQLELSDNCDAEPTVEVSVSTTQADDGCSAFSFEETRTWTVSDACGNSTSYTQVITVIDTGSPECMNCPADVTVSCDAVPEVPSLDVTDNCDPAPEVTVSIEITGLGDGRCGVYAYTETRTFTISDACGNSTVYVQVITVEDNTAPELSCPESITVTCSSDPALTGMPQVTDNCDPEVSVTYEDFVLSGNCDWACMIERSWTATDICGNVSTCTQTIQQSVAGLAEDALADDLDGDALADPLVIGRLNRHSLTITSDGAECLIGWLPNNGGSAWPLIRKDFLIDGSDCAPAGLPIGADGKLANPLISETLILGLKLRMDPSVGEIPMTDLECQIHPIVFHGLPANPTVADLYAQANLVVANIIGLPFVEYYAAALACVNGAYGICPDENEEALTDPNADAAFQVSGNRYETPQVRIYPNPARSKVWLDLSAFSGSRGQIRLINAVGQNVLEQQLGEIGSESVSLPLENLSSGFYLVQIRIGEQLITRQLVISGE